jgi:predicted transcriptional regulator of viral defense system
VEYAAMTAKALLIARARPHDGVFTTSDALACGVTRRMLEGLAEGGEIVRVHRGVYRFVHVPVTPIMLLRAAVAATDGDAVASHSSAAMLLGLDQVPLGTPEITVGYHNGATPRLHGVRVHTSRHLPPTTRRVCAVSRAPRARER